jgi:hypothetical protein
MKLWYAIILAILLIAPLVLSSCDLLGIGGKSTEEQNYELQMKALQMQQEANQKAQDAYYQNLQQGLNDYYQQYNQYQQAQQQQQIQQIEQALKEQQAQEQANIPYN